MSHEKRPLIDRYREHRAAIEAAKTIEEAGSRLKAARIEFSADEGVALETEIEIRARLDCAAFRRIGGLLDEAPPDEEAYWDRASALCAAAIAGRSGENSPAYAAEQGAKIADALVNERRRRRASSPA